MRSWKLEDAKNRFSEVVRRALADGPQRVTRSGRDAVVVLSAAQYEQLIAPPQDLVEFLQHSPLAAAIAKGELNPDHLVARPHELGRDLSL